MLRVMTERKGTGSAHSWTEDEPNRWNERTLQKVFVRLSHHNYAKPARRSGAFFRGRRVYYTITDHGRTRLRELEES